MDDLAAHLDPPASPEEGNEDKILPIGEILV
jgi:hypothetical protein